jgi:hypothetical protein
MRFAVLVTAGMAVAAMFFSGTPSMAAPEEAPRVAVEGTVLLVTLPDGHILPQHELSGFRVALGDGAGRQRLVRIDAVAPDPHDASGEVMLYALSEQDPASGAWRNVCQPDPDGKRLGFPMSGAFTTDGRYVPVSDRLSIVCAAGPEGKCVRAGVKPWRRGVDGTSLAAAYNSCMRRTRVDDPGDDRGGTRSDQTVAIYDTISVQSLSDNSAYKFEAGFAADGVVCVRQVRVSENTTQPVLEKANLRFAGRPGDASDQAFVCADGATMFVRSEP